MLAIDKPVTLSSAGAAATVIDARNAVVAANVRIRTRRQGAPCVASGTLSSLELCRAELLGRTS
jgi:hypothetical protein